MSGIFVGLGVILHNYHFRWAIVSHVAFDLTRNESNFMNFAESVG